MTESQFEKLDTKGTDGNSNNIIQNKPMDWYNIITLAILIVTFISTTVLSIASLRYSRKSTKAALKAAEISEKALDDSRKSAKKSAKESEKRFAIDSANAQAQIDALNEAVWQMKNQYAIENFPVLDLKGIAPNFGIGEQLNFFYAIQNLGKNPVFINSTKIGTHIDRELPTSEDIRQLIDGYNKEVEVGWYTSKESPFEGTFLNGRVIDQNLFEQIVSKNVKAIFFGEVKYIIPANGSKWKYVFAFQLTSLGEPNATQIGYRRKYIENRNSPD